MNDFLRTNKLTLVLTLVVVALVGGALLLGGSPQGGIEQGSAPAGPPPSPSPGCDAVDRWTDPEADHTVDVDGVQRQYNLHLPDASAQPAPVILNLHGALGGRARQEERSNLPDDGTSSGFVVVSPRAEGDPAFWDLNPTGTDVHLLTTILDEVHANVCTDESRVTAAGFSQGAMMSIVFACHEPERIAGIAAVGGLVAPECPRPDPLPILAVHGTADSAIDFDGDLAAVWELMLGVRGTPIPTTARVWAERNGCEDEPPASELDGVVQHLRFDCDPASRVELYVVDGGTHRWPRGRTTSLDATAAIIEFASEVHLPAT